MYFHTSVQIFNSMVRVYIADDNRPNAGTRACLSTPKRTTNYGMLPTNTQSARNRASGAPWRRGTVFTTTRTAAERRQIDLKRSRRQVRPSHFRSRADRSPRTTSSARMRLKHRGNIYTKAQQSHSPTNQNFIYWRLVGIAFGNTQAHGCRIV